MRRTSLKIVVLLTLLLSIFACSRYEDGPLLSFNSPEKRVSGLWDLAYISVENTNRTAEFYTDSTYLRFLVYGESPNMFIALVEKDKTSIQMSVSSFSFSDDKEEVYFSFPMNVAYETKLSPVFTIVPALTKNVSWEIEKLTMKDFIIETEYQDVDFCLNFCKLEND